ncbi:MAG: DUF6477 family protein [Pseudomonadota bacterium]
MNDILTLLRQLKRSKLLVKAARHGLADYVRDRDLGRILGLPKPPSPRQAALRLLEEEAALERARSSGVGSYRVTQHVDVMIALMAEAQLVRQAAQTKASGIEALRRAT